MLFLNKHLRQMLEIVIEMALTSFAMIYFIGCLLNIFTDCFKEHPQATPQDTVPKKEFDRLLEILRKRTLKMKRLRREVRQHHKACRRYRSDKEHLRIYLED